LFENAPGDNHQIRFAAAIRASLQRRKREMSNLDPIMDIISIAQHASPKRHGPKWNSCGPN